MRFDPRHGAILCFALWLASLPLPAVEVAGGAEFSGARVLAQGWRAAENGVLAWFANPCFLLSLVLGVLGRLKLACWLGGIALVLALTSFGAGAIARSSGASVPDLSFGPGFYLWLLTLLVWCAWAGWALRQRSAAQ